MCQKFLKFLTEWLQRRKVVEEPKPKPARTRAVSYEAGIDELEFV